MKKMVIIGTVPLSFATLLKGQPRYLSEFFDLSIITSSDIVNKEIEKYEGVSIYAVDMTRQITIVKDFKALLQIYLYLVKNRPDIVYSFTPKAGLLGMIASFVARVPVRVHNIVGMPLMEATGKRKILLKFIERLTYFFSTKLYCNSFGLKDYIETNLTKKSVKVIAQGSINGVDSDFFEDTFTPIEKEELRNRLGFNRDDFVLIFVGRVVKDKGVNELIDAFSILKIKYPYLKLLMVGDFEEKLSPIDQNSMDAIKNNDSIKLVGFQKDIRPYLSVSNLFVLPSYREGLPNSLIEAGSYGVPLLATDINGCNEVIIENKTGILIKKKSVDSLVEGVSILLENRELYNKIKESVRSLTINRYGQEKFFKILKDELGSL